MSEVEYLNYYDEYSVIINALDAEILVQVDGAGYDDNDYDGYTHLLVREGARADGRIGIITFGWGHCPGCDALIGCNSSPNPHAEVTKLRDEIWDSAHWENGLPEMLEYLTGKNWALDPSYRTESWNQFYAQAEAMLIHLIDHS